MSSLMKLEDAGPDVSVRGKARDCFGPGIVDTVEFADHIQRRLAGNVVGFGFAINERGNREVSGTVVLRGYSSWTVMFCLRSSLTSTSSGCPRPLRPSAALQLMEKRSTETQGRDQQLYCRRHGRNWTEASTTTASPSQIF